MKYIIPVLAFVFISLSASAQEVEYNAGDIVVTPSRYSEPLSETGSSVDVVYGDDIEDKGGLMAEDVLRGVPGVTVVNTGGLGGTGSVFIRGAQPYHTLVMIDGLEMNDPMSPNRSFDFANLTADSIDRIEIVKGPQSTLYGSDAMAGVINIITKKGEGSPVIGAVFQAGSYRTYKESVYSRGRLDKWDYSVSLTGINSSGFSQAKGGSEKDGYENITLNGAADVYVTPRLKASLVWRYLTADADVDKGAFTDDTNYTAETERLSGRMSVTYLFRDWWKQDLSFSGLSSYRDFRDMPDAAGGADSLKSWFDGETFKGDWQNTVDIGDISTLVGGVEFQEETGRSYSQSVSSYGAFIDNFTRQTADTLGVYLQDILRLWKRLTVTGGGRFEDHSLSGSRWDYKLWANYVFPHINTRVKASVGTGFKEPSLFQLFSSYGDTSLRPEEVISYDIVLRQLFFTGRLSCSITYFNNSFDNLIDFDTVNWRYINIKDADTSGVEAEADWIILKGLTAGVTYTYLDTEDKETGLRLVRRPRHMLGAFLKWYFRDVFSVYVDLVHTGRREDYDFTGISPSGRVTLSGYNKLDVTFNYRLNKQCKLFAGAENLLDEKYEEAYGYNTARISGYTGINIEF